MKSRMPEYCCDDFYLALCMSHIKEVRGIYKIQSLSSKQKNMTIKYCPFCGAKIKREEAI